MDFGLIVAIALSLNDINLASQPQTSSVEKKIIQHNLSSSNSNLKSSDCQKAQILSANSCVGDDFSFEEEKLSSLLNQYRAQNQLPAIPLSSSLSRLANRHIRDLQENLSQYNRSGKDWRFGWSNCPYDGERSTTYSCMWAAPQRLKTSYQGKAYEMICGGDGQITAQAALRCWQNSPLNKDLLLNQGLWRNYKWQAIGISLDRGYAILWLGQEADGINLPRTPQTTPTTPSPTRGRRW